MAQFPEQVYLFDEYDIEHPTGKKAKKKRKGYQKTEDKQSDMLWLVDRILDHRQTGKTTEYLVSWRSTDEAKFSPTWEPEEALETCEEVLKQYQSTDNYQTFCKTKNKTKHKDANTIRRSDQKNQKKTRKQAYVEKEIENGHTTVPARKRRRLQCEVDTQKGIEELWSILQRDQKATTTMTSTSTTTTSRLKAAPSAVLNIPPLEKDGNTEHIRHVHRKKKETRESIYCETIHTAIPTAAHALTDITDSVIRDVPLPSRSPNALQENRIHLEEKLSDTDEITSNRQFVDLT
ncbi:chromodomain Y-like protein [Reticulomyxa filosa]|uniref:Chromodomain Y-like protein n=1 Tax=Reticulomyxa filosa TaxID=46433 RepID=X6MLQ9_RETFI|nr:chromodomain Y-like protein [Reticulomyxa filosa]|eukprot:ETO14010.1 chromodomain Y-like protein [Reticulomyxa filosa]